jgi:hypothetical protein
VAPVALSVELKPEQMVAGAAAATTVGLGVTFWVNVMTLVHPAMLVPVNVYVVVTVGVMASVEPAPPGFHV